MTLVSRRVEIIQRIIAERALAGSVRSLTPSEIADHLTAGDLDEVFYGYGSRVTLEEAVRRACWAGARDGRLTTRKGTGRYTAANRAANSA